MAVGRLPWVGCWVVVTGNRAGRAHVSGALDPRWPRSVPDAKKGGGGGVGRVADALKRVLPGRTFRCEKTIAVTLPGFSGRMAVRGRRRVLRDRGPAADLPRASRSLCSEPRAFPGAFLKSRPDQGRSFERNSRRRARPAASLGRAAEPLDGAMF
mgnify:CR=1 FL=1